MREVGWPAVRMRGPCPGLLRGAGAPLQELPAPQRCRPAWVRQRWGARVWPPPPGGASPGAAASSLRTGRQQPGLGGPCSPLLQVRTQAGLVEHIAAGAAARAPGRDLQPGSRGAACSCGAEEGRCSGARPPELPGLRPHSGTCHSHFCEAPSSHPASRPPHHAEWDAGSPTATRSSASGSDRRPVSHSTTTPLRVLGCPMRTAYRGDRCHQGPCHLVASSRSSFKASAYKVKPSGTAFRASHRAGSPHAAICILLLPLLFCAPFPQSSSVKG